MKIINPVIKSLLLLLIALFCDCKGFVEIDTPKDQVVDAKVYTDDETATSAVRGIYAAMMSNFGLASGYSNGVTFLAGRSADEFSNFSSDINYTQFSSNSLLSNNSILKSGLWQEAYKYIYYANLVLENIAVSDGVSAPVKQQLQGEAKFIRAFCHFYLTNLFGDVPIVLTTDYRINSIAFASTGEQIYSQMIKDLNEAKNLLSVAYPSTERIRVNKWAATALLARVYLYHREWQNASVMASEVIAQDKLYKLPNDLNAVFLKNSDEAILQFVMPLALGQNTREGNIFILDAPPGANTQVVLNEALIKAFEPDDLRLENWVGIYTSGSLFWHFPFKYKIKTGVSPRNEYTMILRLAEQYLIRAEAQTMLKDFDRARADLNTIRRRAGLEAIAPNTQTDLLDALVQERRVELFSEWGHRWLDLKRMNKADDVLSPLKDKNWQSTDILYPIPATEILNNPNLNQNKGYN